MEWLKEIWQKVYKECTATDPLTWVMHWIIAFVLAAAVGYGWGALGGMVTARVLLVVFAVREGLNWQTHWMLGKPNMKAKTIDGVMDMVGPVASDILWSIAYYG